MRAIPVLRFAPVRIEPERKRSGWVSSFWWKRIIDRVKREAPGSIRGRYRGEREDVRRMAMLKRRGYHMPKRRFAPALRRSPILREPPA